MENSKPKNPIQQLADALSYLSTSMLCGSALNAFYQALILKKIAHPDLEITPEIEKQAQDEVLLKSHDLLKKMIEAEEVYKKSQSPRPS